MRRWRLVLGGDDDGTGSKLTGVDLEMDKALAALYNKGGYETGGGAVATRGRGRGGQQTERSAGLGASSPQVARWLGDIRNYFPQTVVQVMQRDAIDRLNLRQLLLEPEMLESVEPDVHLVGTLLSLNHLMPAETKETARQVVRKLVEDLEKRLGAKLRATVSGALDKSARTSRPRHSDIDWDRTIQVNLKNYLPEYQTVVPERLVGYARKERAVKRDVVLAIDQSGSMAASVVYAVGVRRGAGLDAVAEDLAGGLRHRGGRPDRRSCRTRSTSCSAPSSAAAPTSTARSPTASR